MKGWKVIGLLLLLGGVTGTVSAQKYPERKEIRQGNKRYDKGDYPGAELFYLRALEAKPSSVEGANNLAGALYKQGRYEEAAKAAGTAARDSLAGKYASGAFYNEGNAYFQQRKLNEAIEAYKNALRRNPDDQQAKFNLAYALKLRDKDKNGGGGGGQNNQDQNQDQNQNQNQNQNQGQNPNNQDQNQDQNKNQDQNQKDSGDGSQNPDSQKQPGQGGQSPQQGGMSPQEAEQMLDAIQGAEDNTKKKVDAQKVRAVGRSGKNW